MKKQLHFLLIFSAIMLFQCCKSPIPVPTVKFYPQDPFKSTIVKSQFFEIDAAKDHVIEGKGGTVLVFPKGCFKTQNGEIFDKNAQIELAEALKTMEILSSNLTTTANGNLLETGGMLFFDAKTSDGQALSINPKNPMYIEIPCAEKKPNMEVYQGIRDENGNMTWVNPAPLNQYLTAVDIFSLDFLPPNFYATLEKNLPVGDYKEASQALADSLYYCLATFDPSQIKINGSQPSLSESYYGGHEGESFSHQAVSDDNKKDRAINPAIIKVIKSDKFQNTFIATREFEKRLAFIFKTCNNAVLEAYIQNFDGNLWEADQKAANLIPDSALKTVFQDFANLRLTTVKDGGKCSALLKDYYKNTLAKVQSTLASKQKDLVTNSQKKNAEAEKTVVEYKNLLKKREKYRMETYGFINTNTGWINVDNGTAPKDWGPAPLEIFVDNTKDFDRAYAYVLYTSIKSLYRLNSDDQSHFYVGNGDDKEMNMPKNRIAIAVAIGYKGETPAFAMTPFKIDSNKNLTLHLLPTTTDQITATLAPFDGYAGENTIANDLVFMKKLHIEAKRQEKETALLGLMQDLAETAFPCSSDWGESLFLSYCASCHSQNLYEKSTGPALCWTEKDWSNYPKADLYAYIRNSKQMTDNGHPRALSLWKEYKPTMMTDFDNLKDEEIKAILEWIGKCDMRLLSQ
jgi:Cytochrome c